MTVTKTDPAAPRRGLCWATGCLVAIYLWTPAALGGNIANLNLDWNLRPILSVFLLAILGLVSYHGLAVGTSPGASETKFLSDRTLSCPLKVDRS
jgi:hypothetical protein